MKVKDRRLCVRKGVSVVVFVIVFATLYLFVSTVFTIDSSESKIMFDEFYSEPAMTHDAIYIGTSAVYSYWKPAYAFNEYGITAYSIATGCFPIAALKWMMEECLKTQNPDLFIIDARSFTFGTKSSLNYFHQIADFMKPSFTKYNMIEDVCESMGVKGKEKLEYYIPIIRFHSRWAELKKSDFMLEPDYYFKGPGNISVKKMEAISPCFTDEKTKLIEPNYSILVDLLEYCKEKDVNVVFVASPFLENVEKKEWLNTMEDIIKSYGFDFYNFNNSEHYSAMGLTVENDYRDGDHTNIWGGIKYTKYFGKILQEKYGLPDRRGDVKYESWNEAYERFWTRVDSSSHSAAAMMGKDQAKK